MNISAGHSEPACGCMSEIVKPEVGYTKFIASFAEGLMHDITAHTLKDQRL